jgi:acyl-homoserine lactone acylase PvdQ
MGYTTDFEGRFKLNKKLDYETRDFLVKFNETRRMKRQFADNKYGVDGEFYVDGAGDFGQDHENSVVDFNCPPSTQPSLWCQWRPSRDGEYIEWDGGEKFYDYVPWLRYLVKNVLAPKGYTLNGEVYWQGEDSNDRGIIVAQDNKITTKIGKTVYE